MWRNPCAGPPSDNVESKVGEPTEPAHPYANTTPTLRLGELYLRPLPRFPDELRPLLEQRFGLATRDRDVSSRPLAHPVR